MITMYDSVDLDQFPANPEAVAGYVGGHFQTYPELVRTFPHAHHLSIAVTAGQRARCLDVEPGDATPSQAPGWYLELADHSQGLPVLYASASQVNAVIGEMSRAGIGRDRYLIWSAHFTGREHICRPEGCGFPRADATQWTDHAMGRNLDQSLCVDTFFQTAPAPPTPPAPPEDDTMLFVVVKQDGRLEAFVEDSKGQVWHTWQTGTDGGWVGAGKGKTTTWQSLGTPGK